MKRSLRGQMMLAAAWVIAGILTTQLILYVFVELTDLAWPPSIWPATIRDRISFWYSQPGELEHEFREIGSLATIGILSIPLVMFAVWRYSGKMFRPVEDIARKAGEISAGEGRGRLPVGGSGEPDEIAAMAGACNLAFERYEEAFRRLEQFARDASHQIRTPLSAIRAAGEVCLSRPRTPEEYRDAIGQILERSAQILSTVEALLERARRDSVRLRDQFKILDFSEIGEAAFQLFRELAEARGVRFSSVLQVRPEVRGDRELLLQALCNLVDNAVKLAPDDGAVTLRSGRDGGMAWLEVQDSGPGLPPEIHAWLSRSPSVDGDEPRPVTGVGLLIASDIMKLHGGTLDVLTEPERGTRFRMTLPVRAAAQEN